MFVDGVDVRDLPLATLRAAIGFVPQEPFLFSDTIGDNIAFGLDAQARWDGAARHAGAAPHRRGRPGDAEQRANRAGRAAAIARLDKDLSDFPKGYDTTVGERGITLSGGQKQRTALARAIAIDPRILVLDDSLSSVDTYTEEEILSRLRGVMRQRTSIIVSHRISTVRDADQILVLDRTAASSSAGPHENWLVARRHLRRARTASSCSRKNWRPPVTPDLMQDDEILGKAYDARLMRRLLIYLRPYWRSGGGGARRASSSVPAPRWRSRT